MKKIAIVGPESTGKSDLAAALALHYNSVWVKEYAREYLNNINRDYNYNDLQLIAEGQIKAEEEMLKKANRILFCDTNLLVIKIWSEFKYGKCNEWILNSIKKRHYDYYLLTDIDLPWQPDPLREHPDKCKELFEIYFNELTGINAGFGVVSGTGNKRLNSAIELIKNIY